MSGFYYLDPKLPWEVSEDEQSRFRKILIGFLLFCLIAGIVVPWIPVPEDVRVVNEVPDRLVKLVIEQQQEEIPPPPVEIPVEEEKPEEEPEPEEQPEPEEVPEPEPDVVEQPEEPTAKQAAEEKAAVFDVFADLRDNQTVNQLTEQTNLTKAGSTETTTTREIIGDSALQDTGGINVSTASSSQGGGGALEGSGTTAVTSKIEAVTQQQEIETAEGTAKVRTSENIQLTFNRGYGQISTPYYRALRRDPSLQGTVVFKLKIMPDGSVAEASVVKSALNNPSLERRILAVIKRLNFGAMNVAIWEDQYPIVFTPR